MNHPGRVEQAQLATLFDRHVSEIFGYLLLRCGSRQAAEDLTADTFTAAAERFAHGDGDQITGAWLQTVARRRLIDFFRRSSSHRSRLQRLGRERDPESAPDTDPDGLVDRALSSLPDRQRAALVLRYVDEFAVAEIAEALGTSYKATESLLSRARGAFETAYSELEP